MITFDRYLLREILKPFLLSIVFVVLLVFMLQVRRLAGAALGLGLTFTDSVIIFGAALPSFLVVVIPLAYLASVLVGMGRLTADLEITAFTAAGASPWQVARVPALLGLAVTVVGLPIAHYAAPSGLDLLYEQLVDVGVRNISEAVRPGVFNESLDGMVLYARERAHDGRLGGVLVYDERNSDASVLSLAEGGALSPTDRGLLLSLDQGEMHRGSPSDTYDRIRFESAEAGIDLARELRDRTRFVSESQRMSSRQMVDVFQSATDPLYARRTERDYWRRFAHPMMAFVFGLLGAAVTLFGRRQRTVSRVVLALAAVVLYFLMSRGADFVVTTGLFSTAAAVFAPNGVLLALAVLFLGRAGIPR